MHCDLYLCIFNRLRPKFVSFPWWRDRFIWFCLIFSLLSLCSSFDVINERHYLERAKSLYNSWKKRYLRRGLRPLNPHQGLCPWTPLGPTAAPDPCLFFPRPCHPPTRNSWIRAWIFIWRHARRSVLHCGMTLTPLNSAWCELQPFKFCLCRV
jgi:hypothetical protein